MFYRWTGSTIEAMASSSIANTVETAAVAAAKAAAEDKAAAVADDAPYVYFDEVTDI